jgi:hypothetical protein
VRLPAESASSVRQESLFLVQTATLRRPTAAPLPLVLSELSEVDPQLRRGVHGYSTAGTWPRLAWRGAEMAVEIGTALPKDAWQRLSRSSTISRLEPGRDPQPHARSVALFVHYAASGRISEMVLRQLHLLAEDGFAVVFITMAKSIAEADWRAVRDVAALVAQRRNFGRDFGAWHDLIGEARHRWPLADEIMLVNDSILGPIRCPRPVFAALREGGPGLFGLTESVQGGPHLQSYLLLARGRAAAGDLARFLAAFRPSQSKWLVVQRGELRLARWMRARGHRVAALFGYQRLLDATLSDPAELVQISGSHPLLREIEALSPKARAALLRAHPLNPTQHLWMALVRKLGFPFLKTELVRRNPGHLPNVDNWPTLVPPDAPCPVAVIRAHLESLDQPVR